MRSAVLLVLLGTTSIACGNGDGAEKQPAPTRAGAAADPLGALELLAVGDARLEPVPAGPLIVLTATAITADGAPIAMLHDGALDAADRSSELRDIPMLRAWAEALALAQPPAPTRDDDASSADWVKIAAAPGVSAMTLIDVIYSLKGRWRDHALLVRGPDGVGMVPLTLRDAAPTAGPTFLEPPLGMVLELTADGARAWSMSRLEGAIDAPRLEVSRDPEGAWLGRVRGDLEDVARRRWAHNPRLKAERQIVVLAGAGVSAGDLLLALHAVRHRADGEELFPEAMIGPGIETTTAAATAAAAIAAEKAREAEAVALREEDVARLVDVLVGEGTASGIEDELSKRNPGSDLGARFEDISEGGAALGLGGGRGTRGSAQGTGGSTAGGVTGAAVTGAGSVTGTSSAGSTIASPPGRVSFTGAEALDESTLTFEAVENAILTKYLAGVKRCYAHELRTDPELREQLTLAFTVADSGRVSSALARSEHATLGACIREVMLRWSFAAPKDTDGEPTSASFTVKLRLIPE